MNRRPRVVHVATSDISLALLLGHQLRALVDAGYDVIGVSGPGPFAATLAERGIRHHVVPSLTRSVDVRADLRAPFDLVRLFRSLQPDLVHTHNPKPGVYGRVAARAARVPAVVNTIHGLYALPEDAWTKRLLVYGLERLAVTCSDAEFVQNPEDIATLRRLRVPAHKLHLLGNGIDLARFDPAGVSAASVATIRASVGAGPDDVLCGLVGRLVWEKGYQEVFAAVDALRRRIPNLRVMVAGPSDDAKADAVTKADVDRAAAAGIVFLGMRDDVEALYAAMDIYVLASYREGWPRSAMEAAAMGVPVVATDVRGCRQVVDDERSGLLVPVRDAVALAGAIERLARDRELRRSMGAAAKIKARVEFDETRVISIILGVYEQLLGSGSAVSP